MEKLELYQTAEGWVGYNFATGKVGIVGYTNTSRELMLEKIQTLAPKLVVEFIDDSYNENDIYYPEA